MYFFFWWGQGIIGGREVGVRENVGESWKLLHSLCHSSAIILVFISEDSLADLRCSQLGVRGEQVDDIG